VIPLRDINPTRTRPVLTYLIIAANIAVFFYQASLDDIEFVRFVHTWGLVPYQLVVQLNVGSLSTPFTSMFMHGGWFHLIFNMWFMHIFGDNVEDWLGRWRFILFYLLCGLSAAAAQVLAGPSSQVPMVGASGAIAGVLGAYVRLYPRARVVTLIPVFFFFFLRELPAGFFIFFWFLIQLLAGVGSLGAAGSGTGGVAFFAHIGGFVAGLFLIRRLRRRRNPAYGWYRSKGSSH
jgi:membrane associated rhomboid family serine protease